MSNGDVRVNGFPAASALFSSLVLLFFGTRDKKRGQNLMLIRSHEDQRTPRKLSTQTQSLYREDRLQDEWDCESADTRVTTTASSSLRRLSDPASGSRR